MAGWYAERGHRMRTSQTQLGSYAEAVERKYWTKARQTRVPLLRHWYLRRAASARAVALSEMYPSSEDTE
jgi:hypothetical protein